MQGRYLTFNYASATPRFVSKQGLITSFAGKAVTNGGAAGSFFPFSHYCY